MRLKLVYRVLRQISYWTVYGFYSEVDVDDISITPRDGPLIIVSTHHNEIIDIATLSVTMPYSRHISFWTKSTMFANPIMKSILESSGAIPVTRNPNTSVSTKGESTHKEDLFQETSRALAAGEVIGVFPEGTSYTGSSISQLMPGAAWAAVEFVRSLQWGEPVLSGLHIVPVAIVYTDKSKYKSRVCVRYGKPIIVDDLAAPMFKAGVDAEVASRVVVANIMKDIETQLLGMTINAPDWDTLCAVRAARNVLWGSEDKIDLDNWVPVSQSLVKLFASLPTADAQKALTKYFALLHYTKLDHATLAALILPPTHTRKRHLLELAFALAEVVCLVYYIPPLLLYIPGYITGYLVGNALAVNGEEESQAQFKAIGGGLGIGVEIAIGVWFLWDRIMLKINDTTLPLWYLGLMLYYAAAMLIVWHDDRFNDKYRFFKKLSAMPTFLMNKLYTGDRLNEAQLEAYTIPPPPPDNIFLKRKARPDFTPDAGAQRSAPPPVPPRKLINHLLAAREDAYVKLQEALQGLEEGCEAASELAYLIRKGAKVPINVACEYLVSLV